MLVGYSFSRYNLHSASISSYYIVPEVQALLLMLLQVMHFKASSCPERQIMICAQDLICVFFISVLSQSMS